MSESIINAIGIGSDGKIPESLFILMVVQISVVVICLALLVGFMLKKFVFDKKKKAVSTHSLPEVAKERKLLGITVDVSQVKRIFKVGEQFDYDGLIVNALYNEAPETELVTDYKIDIPILYEAGSPLINVAYGGFNVTYTIVIEKPEKPVEQPKHDLLYLALDLSSVKREFFENEPFDYSGIKVVAHYKTEPVSEAVYNYRVDMPDMSAEGSVEVTVHCGDFRQTYPIIIKKLRKFKDITLNTDRVRREFFVGEKFNADGLIVTANYSADPSIERVFDYNFQIPDMNEVGTHSVVVTYAEKSAEYAINIIKPEPQPEPQSQPESQSLSKEQPDSAEETKTPLSVQSKKQPDSVEQPKKEDNFIQASILLEEDSVDDGILRYDRSFLARLIQSDDNTKKWYSKIKNELLSYRNVKDRISWKKETYKLNKDVVAKFGFRGKTLCLFLALDYAEYADSKYKLEDVSVNRSYADTPCMYRIKNEHRVKYAFELIQQMMDKRSAKRVEHVSEDYYMPFEGVAALIDKKLIKRDIKSTEDEAIFYSDLDDELVLEE